MQANIQQELTDLGYHILGQFHASDWQDYKDAQQLSDCNNARLPSGEYFILIASTGQDFWQNFKQADDKDSSPNPLDDFTRNSLQPVLQAYQAEYYHPSDKPYLPFQHYCLLLNHIHDAPLFHRSPLNILFHYRYGLWYGLRGLLVLKNQLAQNKFAQAKMQAASNQCLTCVTRDCIRTCPAQAVTEDGFRVDLCSENLRVSDGCHSACMARNACPYAEAYRYGADKQDYLMTKRLQNVLSG